MTDSSMRIYSKTRRRLNIYKETVGASNQSEAIEKALDEAGAPEVDLE